MERDDGGDDEYVLRCANQIIQQPKQNPSLTQTQKQQTKVKLNSPTSSNKKCAISTISCTSCKFCARLIALTTSSGLVLMSSFDIDWECS